MVDWATQNRLYPSGYQIVDIRTLRNAVNSALLRSTSASKKHNCNVKKKQVTPCANEDTSIESLRIGIHRSVSFCESNWEIEENSRSARMIVRYASNINWPRSVCCLTETDGSIVVCEQNQCRIRLFTSQLVLVSTCGGIAGNGLYQFDSPWSVASLFDNLLSTLLVADTNNQRVQFFTIGYKGEFIHKHTLAMDVKPFYISTSKRHIAISCARGLIKTFLSKEIAPVANIDLNRILSPSHSFKTAVCLCMDPENSFIFVSNPIMSANVIHQLSVKGEYVRSIRFQHQPFLHVSCLTFDQQNRQLIIADSLNSIIYSLQCDSRDNNVEILMKRSDNINYPQSLCIDRQGRLVIAECSISTQHALKIFRYNSHNRLTRRAASTFKTSETTSSRSFIIHN